MHDDGVYYRGKRTSVRNLGSKRGGGLFSNGRIFGRVRYKPFPLYMTH